MIEIKVYSDIAKGGNDLFMRAMGFEDSVFSLDAVKNILDSNPDEDIKLSIHCDGGSVTEGLAIYDYLRTSGRDIYTNIDGSCHSMAVVLLLAAPYENRTANANSRSLIHKVYANLYGSYNDKEIEEVSEYVKQEQESILKIYADRTNMSIDELRNIMSEEKQRTADELLEWGFVSKINNYNTNKKSNRMARNKRRGTTVDNLAEKTKTFLSNLGFSGKKAAAAGSAENKDFSDDSGVIFSTEGEEDVAPGVAVTMAEGVDSTGTFELTDGRFVTIVESVVDTVVEPGEVADHIEELEEEIAELENKVAESAELLTNYLESTGSEHKPKARGAASNKKSKTPAVKNAADLKAEAREKRKARKEGGK